MKAPAIWGPSPLQGLIESMSTTNGMRKIQDKLRLDIEKAMMLGDPLTLDYFNPRNDVPWWDLPV